MQLFGKKPTVKEQVRTSQREITRGCRDLEREVLQLKREEQKLVKEIKAAASKGNNAGAKQLAKQLIRIRQQQQKLMVHNAQLKGISAQVTVAGATNTVGQTMASATAVMGKVGQTMDPMKVQQQMKEFSVANERMNMAGEMIDDAIDGALDDDLVEDETEELMGQVLDEIGIDLSAQMAAAPSGSRVTQGSAQRQQQAAELDDRLAALK